MVVPVCQPAEIGTFLRDVTGGKIVSCTSAELFDPSGLDLINAAYTLRCHSRIENSAHEENRSCGDVSYNENKWT